MTTSDLDCLSMISEARALFYVGNYAGAYEVSRAAVECFQVTASDAVFRLAASVHRVCAAALRREVAA